MMSNLASLYIRLALGVFLFLSGLVQAVLDPAAEYAEFAEYFVPMWLFWPGALLKLTAGLAVVIGFKTRYSAIALSVFCLVTAIVHLRLLGMPVALEYIDPSLPATILKDYPVLGDSLQGIHLPYFFKDLAMSGGYLALALLGAGRFSVDAWLEKRTK